MEKVKVVDGLFIGCPEGFHVMDREELKEMEFIASGPGIVMRDPERRMIVSVGVQKLNGFSALMLNQKELAENMEKRIADSMQFNGYQFRTMLERKAGADKANGLSYEYTAKETEMYAESFAVKKGKNVTYYHMYSRNCEKDDNIAVWEEILGSVETK